MHPHCSITSLLTHALNDSMIGSPKGFPTCSLLRGEAVGTVNSPNILLTRLFIGRDREEVLGWKQ
jgi:hypothetical protein